MKIIDEQYAEYSAGEKRINELYHKIAMQIGISDSAMWVFYCIRESNVVHTQSTIAEKMGVPKQTINSAINRLLKDGFIYMERLPVSGNRKQIILTEAGNAFCEKNIIPLVKAEERAFDRFSDEEQKQYLALGIRHNQFLSEEFQNLLKTL